MNKPTREEWDSRLKELIMQSSIAYNEKPIVKLTFKQYHRRVNKLTEKVKGSIEGIEKRGWDSYHIDHKISIHYGFKNEIEPEKISDISNLRMLPKKTNTDKGNGIFVDSKNEWIIKKEQ
jgi:hypothetical protein